MSKILQVRVYAIDLVAAPIMKSMKNHAKLSMAITSKLFVWFTRFDFRLIGLEDCCHFLLIASVYAPSNRHNTPTTSFWHPCTSLEKEYSDFFAPSSHIYNGVRIPGTVRIKRDFFKLWKICWIKSSNVLLFLTLSHKHWSFI